MSAGIAALASGPILAKALAALEPESKLTAEEPVANDRASYEHQGLMGRWIFFFARFQFSELVEPSQCPFDKPARFCPSRCRELCDVWPGGALSPFFDRLAVRFGIISAVSLNVLWPKARSTSFPFNVRDLVEQG